MAETNDMDEICRVCFVQGDLLSLFESPDSIQLSVKMMWCASVKVFHGDDFPPGICGRCAERLNISYDFRNQCEKSEGKLRERLATLRSQTVPPEGKPPDVIQKSKTLKKKRSGKKNERTKRSRAGRKVNGLLHVRNSEEDNVCETKRDSPVDLEWRLSSVIEPAVDSPRDRSDEECSDGGRSESENNASVHIEKRAKIENEKKEGVKKPKHSREQCFTCGKVMSSRYRLQMHLRTHTGEKPHACDTCPKRFSLAQSLRVHERTHTGEKPLACATCGKTFAQAAGLATHVRLHTGETPYHCALCPMSFRTTAHRQYHVRKHTGEKSFECGSCGRAFITSGDLKQHARIHTGERPFVCTVCGVRMTRSSHLTRHMMTHTGEKPHRCAACGSSYAQRGDLLRHAKRHLAEPS